MTYRQYKLMRLLVKPFSPIRGWEDIYITAQCEKGVLGTDNPYSTRNSIASTSESGTRQFICESKIAVVVPTEEVLADSYVQ